MATLTLILDALVKISPIIIAIASIIALFQIGIAKNDIKIRSKREAVTLAADKCAKLARELLPMLMNNFVNPRNKFTLKNWELKDYNFTISSLKDPGKAEKWVDEIRAKGNYVKSLDFLNEIEALAMYFANGAADEKVAYPVIGSVFCQWVINFSPLLIKLREDTLKETTSGPYQNTVDLFGIWVVRLNKNKLQEEVDTLHARMSAADQVDIRPIGV